MFKSQLITYTLGKRRGGGGFALICVLPSGLLAKCIKLVMYFKVKWHVNTVDKARVFDAASSLLLWKDDKTSSARKPNAFYEKAESFCESGFLLLLFLHPTMGISFCRSAPRLFAWEESWSLPNVSEGLETFWDHNILQGFFLEYTEWWRSRFSSCYPCCYGYCENQLWVLCQNLWKHGETQPLRLHAGNKASKVQHENIFYLQLQRPACLQTAWVQWQAACWGRLQVVFATGSRVNGTETSNLCWKHKYMSQATCYLTPQRHIPKPNLYTLRQNRFLHIRESPVT